MPAAGALKTVEDIKAASGTVGSGPVNRRIRKGKTVKGSSKFHVFADVGKAGKLVCRERGCHQPECHCWAGQYNRCKQVPRDSLGLVQAGHPLLPQPRQIAPDSQAEHMIPLTRNALCRRGIALAGGSEGQLELGDVIAVYVDDASEQIMLGQITRLEYTITADDAVYTWMGQMLVGDRVVYVHKFDPVANGIASRHWELRDTAEKHAQFPIWIEDIRVVKVKLTKHVVPSARVMRSSNAAVNPIDVRWEISSDERERFMVTLPVTLKDGENSDPHASKRRKSEFVEPEASSDSGEDNTDDDN